MRSKTARIDCAGICDGAGLDAAPASILLAHTDRANAPFGFRILAAGPPDQVSRHPEAAGARRVDMADVVLIPGLVNAHAHLDLTHLGPRPHDPTLGFAPWARMIRDGRQTDPNALEASVRQGVERSLAGAVVAVGDIAGVGALLPLDFLRNSPLQGVSFIEFFGIAEARADADRRLSKLAASRPIAAAAVRMGLQPHAPYSAGLPLYQAAAELSRRRRLPLATHLAETPEEFEFVAEAGGPLREMLSQLGVWSEDAATHIGRGRTPVGHLQSILTTPIALAHVNSVTEADIELLARSRAVVVYCPRAHAYFGHETRLGPHPWRRLLDAGVTVALGTDSIVSLAPTPGDPEASRRLSVFDEMRLLRRRDNANPATLLRMGTTAGAAALRLRPSHFTFSPGPIAGMAAVALAIPPAESAGAAALDATAPPRLLDPATIFYYRDSP